MSDHIYAYGVVDAEDFTLDVSGVQGGRPVRTVTHRSLSAIVTDIDEIEPERTDEDARAHDEVLREVMTEGDGRTVVPMQFGMTFKSARTLKSVLRGGRRAFRKALMDVEGKLELGVRVVRDEDASVDGEAVAADISERLEPVSEGEAENDLFSDRLVFNRSYLVPQDGEEAFRDVVEEIREEYDDMTVQYTGPWAPYSFVDIEIGAQ
jgi:hypothetical protein